MKGRVITMLEYRLSQEQKHRLTITPEMGQCLHMLMLPGHELVPYLREQVLDNPLLELVDQSEVSYYNLSKRRTDRESEPLDSLWNARTNGQTLEQSIKDQLRFLSISPDIYRLAVFMAGNLNDNGYLEVELAEVCERLNVTIQQAEDALEQLQALEPAGIGSRNLRECLLLQIRRASDAVPYADAIVEHYLEDMAHARLNKITVGLGISRDEVAVAIQYIQSLNPRPGLHLCDSEYPYVIPDAVVEWNGEKITVTLHETNMPKLQLNADNMNWTKHSKQAELSSFLHHRYQSARWLIRGVEQRKQTLLRVIHAIMEEQHLFLMQGVRGMRPMTLAQLAMKLGLHESTISRATHEKYVITPHGVFNLRYFFTAGLSTSSAQDVSAESVKLRIKELIGQEDKQRPYSDQELSTLLSDEGIQISRRTVAKYREEMKLLSSSRRKRKV